jgi:hypothetical protein
MRRTIAFVTALVLGGVFAASAAAATATPFGGATVDGGVLTLVSDTGDASSANDASGASFSGTGVTTFASISTLSTEFDVTDDDCSGGSPRFQVQVQTSSGAKNVFVYLGPAPSFTGCSQNVWVSSGNLVGSSDARFDTSQIQSGTQASTYAQALALVGGMQVTGISLVVDSGWAFSDKEQTVRARNVRIDGSTFYVPQGNGAGPGHGNGTSPGQACKQLRDDMGVDAFHAAYGTNWNHRNAFGKCVSQMARMKSGARRDAAVERIARAADRCYHRTTSGHGHGKGDDEGRTKHAHGKEKSHSNQLAKCLRLAM